MKTTKKLIAIALLSLISISSINAQENANCDAATIKSEMKSELKPDYKYDSSKITRYATSADFQGKEIEVPLFEGEKYRLVFNITDANKNFQLYVYNQKAGTKNRKALFALKNVREAGKTIYTYEPQGEKKLYITYVIPPSLEGVQESCVAFMLGYKF